MKKILFAAWVFLALTMSANVGAVGGSVGQVRNVYSSTNVTTAAWVELIASTTEVVSLVEVFDSSGQTMRFGVGAVGSERTQFYILPGGNGQVQLNVPRGSRISVRAVSATANSGEIDVNFYN